MRRLVLLIHNVRSTHNVGSMLRTADGLGVEKVYMSGYTPYPKAKDDSRLPHIALKLDRQIHKTALGAEQSVKWEHAGNLPNLSKSLKDDGFLIAALEQSKKSISLPDLHTTQDVAIIVGSEVGGLDRKVLSMTDSIIEIPMLGKKESYNVASAAAIAIYHLRWLA